MRRTKQSAEPQRRRGIRSRLVACVAAVAMLVTSVAAGTAVAVELGDGNVADQSTQNTTSLDQGSTGGSGEQGVTGNVGQSGEQSGEQSTGDQSTGSGDTTEGGSGDTGTNGTTVDDGTNTQSQNDSTTRNVNEVPAPQSADNADAGVAVQAEGDESGTELFTESFTGTTLGDGWVLPEGANNSACLTAATSGEYVCTETEDTSKYMQNTAASGTNRGEGYLQLTDNSTGKNGVVLYDRPVYANAGLDIEFDQWQFGGSKHADGIGFFLTQGSGTIKQGPQGEGVGGALGYATAYNASSDQWVEGIKYGLLGIGLDAWGNFSGTHQVGSDSNPDGVDDQPQNTNSVTVRGAGATDAQGEWVEGYNLVAKNKLDDDGLSVITSEPSQANTENDDSWWPWSPREADNVNNSGQANGVHVHITLHPEENGKQHLTVALTPAGQTQETTVIDTQIDAIHGTVRFGFSASTGSETDAHFIRNMKITSVIPVGDITLAKEQDVDSEQHKNAYEVGDSVPYQFTITNTGGHALQNVTLEDQFLQDETLSCSADGTTVDLSTAVLQPGAQWVCTGSTVLDDGYPTISEDSPAGWNQDGTSFTNIATVTGSYTGDDGTLQTVTAQATATVPTIKPLGEPAHRKYITKKAGENDEYTLHLDVTGRSESSPSTTGTAADVVLVLDGSTSMKGDRLSQLKKAANGLVDKLLTAENASLPEAEQTRVGVMWFSDDAEPYDFANGWNTRYYTTDSNEAERAISGGQADGNTYWNNALDAVEKNYSSDRDVSKYVVFVTDGAPSRSGYEFNSDLYDEAVTSGVAVVSAGWNVVNVSVDLAEQFYVDPEADLLTYGSCSSNDRWGLSCTVDGNNRANWGQSQKKKDWVNTVEGLTRREETVAQSGQTVEYVSASSGELNDIFDDLAETITHTAQYEIVSITDTLSEWVEPVDWTGSGDITDYVTVSPTVSGYSATYDATARTVTVTFPENYRPDNGATVTVSFDVQPSSEAYEKYAQDQTYPDTGGDNTDDPKLDGSSDKWISTGKKGFYTNADAYVTYREVVNGEARDDKTAGYVSPVVTVKAGSIKVSKDWNPSVPSSVESVTVGLYKNGGEAPVATAELNAENGWSSTFANLAPGAYTVKEQTTVPGYASEVSYENGLTEGADTSIVFTGDDLHKDSYSDGSFAVTVTNTLQTYEYDVESHLGLHKELAGNGAPDLKDDMFRFRLEAMAKNADGVLVSAGEGGVAGMALPDKTTVSNGDISGNGHLNPDDPSDFDFGSVTFSQAGTYYLCVVEETPQDDEIEGVSGVQYDRHALYIEYTIQTDPMDGALTMTGRRILNADRDTPVKVDGATWTNAFADGTGSSQVEESDLTWTNTYVAVSSLPLTGGDSTARALLLSGGGVLLVAGAAWLLARRRRV